MGKIVLLSPLRSICSRGPQIRDRGTLAGLPIMALDPQSTPEAEMKHYSVLCRDCSYRRNFGDARITAETKSTVHALKRGHTVELTAINLVTLTTETEIIPRHKNPQMEAF